MIHYIMSCSLEGLFSSVGPDVSGEVRRFLKALATIGAVFPVLG